MARQRAHFIEKQRAVIGFGKLSELVHTIVHAAGMPRGRNTKENLIGPVGRKGPAIDGHEGAAPASAAATDRAGQRFLAAARLALDQKGASSAAARRARIPTRSISGLLSPCRKMSGGI